MSASTIASAVWFVPALLRCRPCGTGLACSALAVGDGARTASVTLELWVFNGLEGVTQPDPRAAVHRGRISSPFVQLSAGPSHAFHRCPAGIYDVQAHSLSGTVACPNIRWARAARRHALPGRSGPRTSRCINFQSGFGALQVSRTRSGTPAGGRHVSSRTSTPARLSTPMTGRPDYLFCSCCPPAAYDLQTRAAEPARRGTSGSKSRSTAPASGSS